MLNLLEGYKGSIEVNGIVYNSLNEAIQTFKDSAEQLTIVLNKGAGERVSQASQQVEEVAGDKIYRIKVRQYMIKPSTPEFDFHDKWNSGNPMPMRIMVGKKLKETKGMVQMELWGEITEDVTTHCMRCGRTLTNPVSKYFGIGPECGNHAYNNPFDDEEQLKRAVKEVDKQLREIKWTGWVIKSALEKFELIRQETYLETR